MDFQIEILDLINKKREGDYWDFKCQPYSNNSDLLHDIICMSNSIAKHDKYIILGVTDNGVIVGVKGSENRKNQAKYIDFLRSQAFAADNRPEIELKTIQIEGLEIDVLIIFDRPNKPFYIVKDKDGVKANYIYTRTGDTNTPKNKAADYNIVEKMWRQRFGLELTPSQRYPIYLEDYKKWVLDIGNKPTGYYEDFPEFQIHFSQTYEGWELYSYFFSNPKSFFGTATFKYLSTALFDMQYAYVDEMRISISVPDRDYINIDGTTYSYFYYEKGSLKFKFLKLLDYQALMNSLKKEYLPFIFFDSKSEREAFNLHLKNLNGLYEKVKKDKHGHFLQKELERDDKDQGLRPNFVSFAVQEFYKWKKS